MRLARDAQEVLMFCSLLGLLLTPSVAGADEIVLINGDRLTGTISTMTKGVLTFHTSYGGPIKIKTADIKLITSDTPVVVHLTNGDVLNGIISTGADQQVEVSGGPARKNVVVGWGSISAMNPPTVESRWSGSLSLAGSLQSGNTDNLAVSIGSKAERKTTKDKISGRILFNYGEEADVRTTENYYGALKYDYFLTGALFVYGSVEALKDAFKDLKMRTAIGPGVGYQIWEDSRKSLAVEGGVSYFNEDRETGLDDSWLTARLGGDFRYNFTASLVFSDQLLVYPSLDDGEYTVRNEAGFNTKLLGNWSVNLSNVFEYDSAPPSDVKRADLTWLLGLQYAF
jgi:putative salt-induced outer membrane protein YdiY